MENEIVMESTTDTPAQMREGLGLAPEPVADTVAADTPSTPTVAGSPSPAIASEPAVAAAPESASPALPRRGPDGKFIAVSKIAPTVAAPAPAAPVVFDDPILIERAARTVAEGERDALKRRLDELTVTPAATKPPPVAEPPPAAPEPFDLDTFRDPAITAAFQAKYDALGKKPQQEDFDDYTEYGDKKDDWIEARATLKAQELDRHRRAGEATVAARQDAQRAVAAQFSSHKERSIAAKARHADYDAVMLAGEQIPFRGRPFADLIQAQLVKSEYGGEMVYEFAKAPAELEKLMALPDEASVVKAIGRWEERIAVTMTDNATAPAGATQSGPVTSVAAPPAAAPVSRAPEPQGTMLGGSASTASTNLEKVKSQQEYNALRNQQERAKRGR